jgi:hypothetical protein
MIAAEGLVAFNVKQCAANRFISETPLRRYHVEGYDKIYMETSAKKFVFTRI